MVIERWIISKPDWSQRDITHGIDYEETFSPLVKFSSVRALIVFAVQNDMLLHQMDVVTAFLNGKLEEEIFYAATGWVCIRRK